jgi:hypothetical protein
VAGIDVGNESHFVAVAPGRDPQPVQEFGSWTADLERMAGWLKACGIQTVVMQSTGVYWIALYDVLEAWGFKICLANARHTKNLPGRKSDVQESQWLLKLPTYGLLRDSFRPPDEIRALRSLWRLRDRHVKEAARAVQHNTEKHDHDEYPVVQCDQRYHRSHGASDHSGGPGRRTESGEVGKTAGPAGQGRRRGGGPKSGRKLAGGHAV